MRPWSKVSKKAIQSPFVHCERSSLLIISQQQLTLLGITEALTGINSILPFPYFLYHHTGPPCSFGIRFLNGHGVEYIPQSAKVICSDLLPPAYLPTSYSWASDKDVTGPVLRLPYLSLGTRVRLWPGVGSQK